MMMQLAQLVVLTIALGTTSPATVVEDTDVSPDAQPASAVVDAEAADAQPDAGPQDTNTDDFFEDVEVEEVVIETVIEAPELHEASLAEKVSHLHPLVVHMPIAWLLLLLLVEWLLVAKPTFHLGDGTHWSLGTHNGELCSLQLRRVYSFPRLCTQEVLRRSWNPF